MSPISRRELLGGLIATAVTANVGCNDSEKPPNTGRSSLSATPTPAPTKGLNVILHGLMAVGVSTSGSNPQESIRLVIPEHNDSPPHVYRAGNIIKGHEHDYKKTTVEFQVGKHSILGLKPGQHPDISDASRPMDFVVPTGSNVISETGRRVFVLPWPKQLLSVRKTFLNPAAANCESASPLISTSNGSADHNSKLTSLATIHILQYDCNENDPQGPRIEKPDHTLLTWQPNYSASTSLCTTTPIANLHIFAEPETSVTQSNINHVLTAFKHLAAIISANGSTLDSKYSFNSFQINMLQTCPDPCYPGIDPSVDLLTLPQIAGIGAGEMANCLKALVSVA